MVQSPAMADVRNLYQRLIQSWNDQDARGMATCLSEQGVMIGFDGSKMVGRAEVETSLVGIFREHPVARFVTIERKIRMLSPTVAMYIGDAGMVGRGHHELNPDVNTRHTLIAIRQHDTWSAELFQNTPAALHGRPDLQLALTEELKTALARQFPRGA